MYRLYYSLVFVLLLVPLSPAGDPPELVAGRSLADHAALMDHDSRVVRLRAIRSLGAFGVAAGDVLAPALEHDDASVRFLAALQLGRIGGQSLKLATPQLMRLAADERSLAVQVAASFALCRAGMVDQHLPLLIKTLEYPERGMACCSADLIGEIGEPAAAAIAPLQSAYAQHRPGARGGDYHIGGAAKNALRKLGSEPK